MSGVTGLESGKHVMLVLPPSWIIGGTVRAVEGDRVILDDAVYVESMATGGTYGLAALASTAAARAKIVSGASPIPDGTSFLVGALLQILPCQVSWKHEARKREADAIKAAR